MKRAFVLAMVVLGACKDPIENNPINPGGGGGGAGGGGGGSDDYLDASLDEDANGDANPALAGRVCLVTDLRSLTPCSTTSAAGITVTLGSETATTDARGDFSIREPAGSDLQWRATGATIVTSVMELSTTHVVPAIRTTDFANMLNANGVVLTPGQGSILAHVIAANAPVVGAIASTSPAAQFGPFYDGVTATVWTESATATFGAVWITGAAVGVTTLQVTPPGGAPFVTTHPVEDQAITFTTVVAP